MSSLHPYTTRFNEPTPTIEEMHGDTNVVTASGYESATAIQEEAERLFADLACEVDSEILIDEQTEREIAEWYAASALRDIAKLHGRDAMEAVVDSVRESLPLPTIQPITAQVRQINLAAFGL